MPSVNIGSNQCTNVAVPLVLDDRFFLLEDDDDQDIWTVFTFDGGKPVVEILRNRPQANKLSKCEANPTGVITVSDPETGEFLYKVRPGRKQSSIFGSIQGKEMEIQVLDREIRIGTSVFSNNVINGFPVGVLVRGGSIGIGAGLPPEFQQLIGQ